MVFGLANKVIVVWKFSDAINFELRETISHRTGKMNLCWSLINRYDNRSDCFRGGFWIISGSLSNVSDLNEVLFIL